MSIWYTERMSYMRQINFGGKKLSFEIDSDADESVFREIFVEKDYRYVEAVISGASLPVLDIGAHKGMFSVYVRGLNPAVRVFAYEPEEQNFAALKKHLKMNHVSEVVAKNLAVTGDGGGRRLYLSEDSHNHSLIGSGDFKEVGSVGMSAVLQRVGKCSLVKMDCEGAEFEILNSLSAENFAMVGVFYIEYHELVEGMRGDDLKRLLEKFGYKVRLRVSPYDKKLGFILAI